MQAVVLLIGTNNNGHTAEQICGGIEAIVDSITERQPQAHILVLVSFVIRY